MNGVTLAYIGDAYYELKIRTHLVSKGFTNVKMLHNKAIKYTSGSAQAKIVEIMISNEFLSDEEIKAYKRGRNNSSSGRKNIDAKTYVMATGFEAVIGHLFLTKLERANQIIDEAIKIIEEGENVDG